MKQIVLSPTELAFLSRVRGYCQEGLNQPGMALREGLTLPGFRSRLQRLGFALRTNTEREVVRLRSGETLAALLDGGGIATQDEQEPAAVA